jgi:hypothetical protein
MCRAGNRAWCALVALWTVAPLAVRAGEVPLLRGDVDHDAVINVTDPIKVLGFLFLGDDPPYCEPVADADDDGAINITDPLYVLNFLFLGGPAPPDLNEKERAECSNAPPVVPPHDVYRTYPGFAIELPIGATDPDGDPVSYTPRVLPPGATLDAATGVLRWTPLNANVGPNYLRFAVSDNRSPPASTEGRISFLVQPLDSCLVPECDPATGCTDIFVPLAEECCDATPSTRVDEPIADCPSGRVLHVGRNRLSGFGQLYNCDRLRAENLGQGGFGVCLNLEARCIRTQSQATFRVRLESADVVFIDRETRRFFSPRDDGYAEVLRITYPIPPAESALLAEGLEAHLTAELTDGDGVMLRRELRVVMTFAALPDLPE